MIFAANIAKYPKTMKEKGKILSFMFLRRFMRYGTWFCFGASGFERLA